MSDVEVEIIEEALISLEVIEETLSLVIEISEQPEPMVTIVNIGGNGSDGLSAYQVAVAQGFSGDEDAWLASLIGADGVDGLGVPAGGNTGQILAKVSGADNDTTWIDPPVSTGNANQIAGFDQDGNLFTVPGFFINSLAGMDVFETANPNNTPGYYHLMGINWAINPLQNSDPETYNPQNIYIDIDTNDDGFSFGRGGQSISVTNWFINHQHKSDIGGVNFLQSNYNFGNGTDPFSVGGISYATAFGNINAGVTVDGPIQGYTFQPHAYEDSIISQYTNAFGDFANMETAVNGHNSFNASPNIDSIYNNSNYSGFQLNCSIREFLGNAGFTGLGIFPQIGKINNGGFQGVVVSPTIADAGNQYCVGLSIDMSHITGTNIKAAVFGGDVQVNGSLQFSGALSIGQLQAYYESDAMDLGGQPQGMHGLTTGITGPANTTTANCDAIGVNTAMLIGLEENSINTSGPFQLGFAALALPCVVETHTGSEIDYMSAAVYALNLSGGSTGGTIHNLNIARAVVIPNGITTVENVRGWYYHEPFGPAGVKSWGSYVEDAENFFEIGLKIGGIPGTSDQLTNGSIGLELEDRAILLARLDNAAEGALTAVNGMIIYNTDTDKFRGYANGSWVDLN